MAIPSRFHVGVVAYNKLPRFISTPATLVINEDPDDKPGSHWVAVFIDKCGCGYFFDSYGRIPKENIERFLNRNASKWVYNPNMLQGFTSQVCGQYCILFLLALSRNYSINDFLNLFTCNADRNDTICKNLFNNYFK